jgi:DNA (cytosine-5)-methyltransferase 1
VDTTKTITHVSLCAGYGGIDLGLGRAIPNLRTIAFSEIEAFACANLVSKMEAGLLDAAPIWTNLKTFPWSEFRDRVDILSGGYPCQPFSAAGKRLGTEDPRHLWPFIAAGIVSMRPRVCFFENVEGHISLGLREVISELEGLGYKVAWGIFSAREVGAPHQRKRVFILAYLCSEGLQGAEWIGKAGEEGQPCGHVTECGSSTAWPSRPGQPQHEWEPPRVVGNAKHDGSHQRGEESRGEITGSEQQGWNTSGRSGEESGAMGNASMLDGTGQAGGQWEAQTGRTSTARNDSQAEPTLGRDSDGFAYRMDDAELFVTSDNRTDELRLLGNGVVPATATRAFLTLMDQLLNQ